MGRWKPILPFAGSTIIETVVGTALRACARVILVVGHRGPELTALFRGVGGVFVVDNPRWEHGMLSSLQRGAEHVRTRRFFVALGDMPWVGVDAYQALAGAPAADVVFPVFDGIRGHPVLFHERVKDALRAADPREASMRGIAARFSAAEVAWGDRSILRDIDTMEDLG